MTIGVEKGPNAEEHHDDGTPLTHGLASSAIERRLAYPANTRSTTVQHLQTAIAFVRRTHTMTKVEGPTQSDGTDGRRRVLWTLLTYYSSILIPMCALKITAEG